LYRRLAQQHVELEALNEALFAQARTDPLTNLANRLCLNEDLAGFRHQVAGGQTYCAIMCDIDHFKLYNDHYGHLAGDAALRAVAACLKDTLRSGDRAYRYGGEEFLVIAPVRSNAEAAAIAERFRVAVERLAQPHQQSPFGIVTLSVGTAVTTSAADPDVSAWLAAADGALYRSKESGRNRNTFRSAA
jgi:diguanylate cyclase (GGDEF)-like protein